MKAKVHFSILIGAVAVLSSCSNYSYISENDVYMQAPTEINLEENENDLTSFNAFKARERGAFTQDYRDPRANETMRFNQMMIMSAYMPYGVMPGRYMNGPMAFHGMGYGAFHPYGFYTGHGMGLRAMYGSNYGYYDTYGPYGYSPYYRDYYSYNYYGSGYYGGGYYGGGYYGGGFYNGIQDHSNPQVNQPVHYGSRESLSSSSNRSSSYPNTQMQTKAPVVQTQSKNAYDVNDQTLGTSRRDVSRRYAGSSDYSNNGKSNNSNVHQGGNFSNSGVVHQRAASQNYSPNESARTSGVVQSQRSVNVSGSSSRSVNSSSPQRSNPSSSQQMRPQMQNSFSNGSQPRSTSSPSTTRSSGTINSNSGRR